MNRHDAWAKYLVNTINSIFSRTYNMSELLPYGQMAEKHWREHCPRLVSELEAENRLRTALVEAQDRTATDMDRLIRDFRKQGLTPQQAHDQAWELVREKYILLPPEQPK